MKPYRYLLLVAALVPAAVALLGEVSAQSGAPAPPGSRIAACDVVEVFNNYQRAKDLTAKLEERRQAIAAENEQRKKAIETLRMEMEGLKEGSPEYEKRFGEMQRLSVERQAYLQFQEQLAMREHHRLTSDMYEQILKVIARVAREQGYQMVIYRERGDQPTTTTPELLQKIERRKLLYCDDGIDITATVLATLNREYMGK